MYILYTFFPLFSDVFNIPVWLPSLLSFVVMVTLFPQAFTNRILFWFIIYISVLVLYFLVGRPLVIGIGSLDDSKKLLVEAAFILPTVSIFCIISYLKDELFTGLLIKYSIVILFVSFIVVIPLMQRYGSIRAALGDDGNNNALGLINYSLMHAYPLFLPVMCYGIKVFNGRQKLWSVIGLLLLCFVIYDTFVTTSLVVVLVILVYTVLYSRKNMIISSIAIVFFLILFYILYQGGAIIGLVDFIMPAFEGTAVEPKLVDFKESMMWNQTGSTLSGRQSLHDISWQAFLHNPIFGSSIAGGHSSLLDRLGGMGLVGALPFFMIIISFIRQMAKKYNSKTAKTFFWVGIVAGFVFLYEKGQWGSENWLMYMVLMPMGILSFERTSIKQEKKVSLR